MRSTHSRNHSSQRSQTLRALVAAALAGGLAVSSASAQSMGGFSRRNGGSDAGQQQQQSGDSSSSDNRRNAPSSQPAPPAQYMPPRVNITPPSAPTRVTPPAQYIPAPAPPRQYTPPPAQYMPPRVNITPPVYNNNGGNNNRDNGFGQSNGNGRGNGGAIAPGAVINNNGNPPMGAGTTRNGYTTYPQHDVNNGGQNNFWRQGGSNRNDSNSNNSTSDNSTPRNGRDGGRSGGSSTETKRLSNPLIDMADESYRRLHPQEFQPIRVTTPQGQRNWDQDWDRNDGRHHHHDNYVYGGGTTIITNGPVLLGGYYYGNYTSYGYGDNIYPSVYTIYGGFPQYICNPSVIVLSQPYYPTYTTPYLPFYQPSYQVTYNQTNYYTTSEDRASDIREGGETAKAAVKSAYTDGTYQAAFADIAKAWSSGNVATLRKHLRDDDTKISILLKRKYAYSIASGDFEQITRDALDRLSTVSFKFTRLRKAKTGDVTAYGKHVYRTTDDSASGDTAVKDTDTVPFDSDQPYDQAGDPAPGEQKVVYVAYTLRHKDDLWYIIAVNSSPTPLVTSEDAQDSSGQ